MAGLSPSNSGVQPFSGAYAKAGVHAGVPTTRAAPVGLSSVPAALPPPGPVRCHWPWYGMRVRHPCSLAGYGPSKGSHRPDLHRPREEDGAMKARGVVLAGSMLVAVL